MVCGMEWGVPCQRATDHFRSDEGPSLLLILFGLVLI